jgi:hypothetical protein
MDIGNGEISLRNWKYVMRKRGKGKVWGRWEGV